MSLTVRTNIWASAFIAEEGEPCGDSEFGSELCCVAEPYVGKYFSQDYLRRKILRQTDEEIVERDKIMEKEIKDGIITVKLERIVPEELKPRLIDIIEIK